MWTIGSRDSVTSSREHGPLAPGWVVGTALAVLALFLASPVDAHAQAPVDSPRIVVVLSGGGARGAAHAGVLAVLEELRVPVHGVVGTSMGAVVGGLWASGLPASELKRVLTEIDWAAVFRDDVPRHARAFRRKEEDRRLLLDGEIGIGLDGLQTPVGLVTGHRLGLLLETLLAPVLSERDFDRLPIPFRATATDLETGDPVVLRHGSLAQVIRASMSAPAAFTPVERGGRLLVDGGLVSNLPLEVAADLDPDVIIAVDAGSDPMSADELGSIFSVAAQVTRLMVRENSDRMLRRSPPDLLLRPELGEFTSTDFPESDAIVRRGEEAARSASELLRQWSVPDSTYRFWREGVERRRAEQPVPKRLRVAGVAPSGRARLVAQLDHHVGVPLDAARLEEDLNRIYGLGRYERVGFDVVKEGGESVLVVNAVPRRVGPATLRFGLALADDLGGTGRFTVATQLLHQPINRHGGELRMTAALGEDQRFHVELHQPVGIAIPLYFQAEVGHRRRSVPRSVGGERLLHTSRRTGGGLSAGIHLGTAARVRVGYGAERVVTEAEGGDSSLPEFEGWQSDLELGLDVDVLDDAALPRRGLLLHAEWASSAPFDPPGERHARAYGEFTWVAGTARAVVMVGGAGGTAIRGEIPYHDQFELGGMLRLSGLGAGMLAGEELALGRVGVFHPIGDPEVLRIGGVLEAGDVGGRDEPWTLKRFRAGITGMLSVKMVWGTAHAALGLTEGGDWAAYLFVGHIPW